MCNKEYAVRFRVNVCGIKNQHHVARHVDWGGFVTVAT